MTPERHDDWIGDRWAKGFFGRLADQLASERQEMPWTAAVESEQRFADMLDRELSKEAIVLHDRPLEGARGHIDHLVVAPSGVWVIGANAHAGRIEQRPDDASGEVRRLLYVNNRDRTKLATKMSWQADAVHKHLALAGMDRAEVHSAICFTSAEWEVNGQPFMVDGTWVIWASALATRILASGRLATDEMARVAAELSGRLRTSA